MYRLQLLIQLSLQACSTFWFSEGKQFERIKTACVVPHVKGVGYGNNFTAFEIGRRPSPCGCKPSDSDLGADCNLYGYKEPWL